MFSWFLGIVGGSGQGLEIKRSPAPSNLFTLVPGFGKVPNRALSLLVFADAAPCAQEVFARVGRPLHFLFIFPGRFLQRSAPIQGTLDQRSPRPAEGAGVSCRCSLGKPTTLCHGTVAFALGLVFIRILTCGGPGKR